MARDQRTQREFWEVRLESGTCSVRVLGPRDGAEQETQRKGGGESVLVKSSSLVAPGAASRGQCCTVTGCRCAGRRR